MGFWPFSRKKRKTDKSDEKNVKAPRDDPSRHDKLSRGLSKASRRDKKRLSRRTSRSSVVSHNIAEKSTPAPPVPKLPPQEQPTPDRFNEKIPAEQQPGSPRQALAELDNHRYVPRSFFQAASNPSQSSIQPEKFNVISAVPEMPTLSKRSAKDGELPRRKSSKRGTSDRQREEEIRQLSSPIPIPKRPKSYSSGLLARDSKRVHSGLNRHFERPTSEISLPQAESIRSSMSGSPDWHHSFRVSAMDALSPRPTIRYSDSPLRSREASRVSTRKDKAPVIPEEDFNTRARMNDLVDDLDARALRELMDRDRRRREKKQKLDHEKLQRKLEKRAEKQRSQAETAGIMAGGDMRETGLGIEERSSQPQADDSIRPANRSAAQSPSSWLQDPSREHISSPPLDPFVDPRSESRLDLDTPSGKDEPVIETAKAVRLSSASMSPPASPSQKPGWQPSNLSNALHTESQKPLSIPHTPERQRLPEPEIRRDSEQSNRITGTLTSFFRRGGTKTQPDKGRATPSEFSNTSRESFARQTPPAVVSRSFKKEGTPQRTKSRFREDLPELPVSPPASRVHSPELVTPSSPYIDHPSKVSTMDDEAFALTPLGDVHPAFRQEVTSTRIQSMRTPSPEGPEGPSSNLLSQSLASVDSEASWLSGRPPKRSSIQANPFRGSAGSLSQHIEDEEQEDSKEPYFTRRNPSPGRKRGPGGLTSQLQGSERKIPIDEDDDSPPHSEAVSPDEETVKYNTVRGQRPNIVQRSAAAKSREGLLDMFNAEEASPQSTPSPGSPIGYSGQQYPGLEEPLSLQRATSVEYGKRGHVRHLSAGSARLLDIPARSPRTSSDQKRLSIPSSDRGRSPLASTLELSNTEDTHKEAQGM